MKSCILATYIPCLLPGMNQSDWVSYVTAFLERYKLGREPTLIRELLRQKHITSREAALLIFLTRLALALKIVREMN